MKKNLSTFNYRFTFSLIIFPVLASLILAEIYFRITEEYVTPEIIGSQSLEYSPSLFSRHNFPEKEQVINSKGIKINKKGYRGTDFNFPKKKNIVRILVYGGSAAFDQNMREGTDWPSRVEEKLNKELNSTFEVINAGIPGHASFDSFGRFFSEGHILNPDYVLLYNGWNDLKYFTSNKSLLRHFEPYRKEFDFRSQYKNKMDKYLCELSQVYVRLRHRYFTWKYNVGEEGITSKSSSNEKITDLSLKQFKINVQLFVDLAKNIGATPVLLTQARLVHSSNTNKERKKIKYEYQKMGHEELVKAFLKTDTIIKEVANSKNIPLFDISKEMTGNIEFFSDHVHLTEKGSKKISQIVTENLMKILNDKTNN